MCDMETEVLVIGSGIAGLTAALTASSYGFDVTLVSKSADARESNTFYAQGGIVYNKGEDAPNLLVNDILRAGDGLVNRPMAEIVAAEGHAIVDDLLVRRAKVPFTMENGHFALTKEAAHSRRRVLFAADATGKSIIQSLYDYAKTKKNIRILTSCIAIDILTADHHTDDIMAVYEKPEALGAYVYDEKKRNVISILAKTTILATGGIGRIYKHSSNPDIATGDGIAMAARAGAKIINMEYTQFHPTTLYSHLNKNFLLSESLRGEGGILINQAGKEFIRHPKGSLAPRDVVSRAINEEMIATHKDFVYLDLSKITKVKIKDRFPTIYKECLRHNVDITKDLIPVVPAFHFSCGGIRTNEWGKTSIGNLFAVGECACTGLHGANRLASTSLLEGVTFGKRVVDYIRENRKAYMQKRNSRVRDWMAKGLRSGSDPVLIRQDWETLRNTMWNYVGISRSTHRLTRAIRDLNNLNLAIEDFYRNTVVTRAVVELRNAVQTGLIIANAAWQNRVSRGCHFRVD